jgi:hypothetical protein
VLVTDGSGPGSAPAVLPLTIGTAVGAIARGFQETVQKVIKSLRWGLTSPFRSGATLAMWGFLAIPVYLAARRRAWQGATAEEGAENPT